MIIDLTELVAVRVVDEYFEKPNLEHGEQQRCIVTGKRFKVKSTQHHEANSIVETNPEMAVGLRNYRKARLLNFNRNVWIYKTGNVLLLWIKLFNVIYLPHFLTDRFEKVSLCTYERKTTPYLSIIIEFEPASLSNRSNSLPSY